VTFRRPAPHGHALVRGAGDRGDRSDWRDDRRHAAPAGARLSIKLFSESEEFTAARVSRAGPRILRLRLAPAIQPSPLPAPRCP
jgi:hypothetical protein